MKTTLPAIGLAIAMAFAPGKAEANQCKVFNNFSGWNCSTLKAIDKQIGEGDFKSCDPSRSLNSFYEHMIASHNGQCGKAYYNTVSSPKAKKGVLGTARVSSPSQLREKCGLTELIKECV